MGHAPTLFAFSFWLALAAAAAGCSGARRHDTHYELRVSPAFDANAYSLIVQAAREWTVATDGALTFDVVIDGTPADEPATIAIAPARQADLGWENGLPREGHTHWTSDDENDVQIAVDADDCNPTTHPTHFQSYAAHEIGHALGLGHSGPGTVMCWDIECASLTVTPADAAAWRALF